MPNATPRRAHPRRSYWSEPDARAALDAHATSGLTLAAFARERGLNIKRLYRWRARLAGSTPTVGPATEPPRFLPVRLVDVAQRAPDLEVVTSSGVRVRVPVGFDVDALASVLRVLDEVGAC